MARTSTVSFEQVAAAAHGLLAKGVTPTARALRDALGTGSMATVLKHFQAWQAGQARPGPAPTTLPRELERLLLDFTAREVVSAKALLESELAFAQQANADLMNEYERQGEALDELGAALEARSAESASITGRLEQVSTDLSRALAEAATERAAAERARTELAKSQLRLEALARLEVDLTACRQMESSERAGRVLAEQLAAVAQAMLDAEAVARSKAEAALQIASGSLLKVTAELGDARLAEQTAGAQLVKLERDHQTVQQTMEALRARLSEAEKEAAQLRGQLMQFRATA